MLFFSILTTVLNVLDLHPVHFSYAELEYNTDQNIFETTLEINAHDFDYYYRNESTKAEDLSTDKIVLEQFEKDINRHFFLQDEHFQYQSNFKIEGIEHKRDGSVLIYMHSEAPKEFYKSLFCTYDLFMDKFSNQENKLSFITNNKAISYVYNPIIKGQWITLN